MNTQVHGSLSDRLKRSAEKAGVTTDGYATAPQAQQKTAVQQEQDVAERTGIELKIKENPFYKTLTDTQTTQEDKISALADALDPKKQPIEKVQANFKAFQEYYTYIQSEDLDEAVDNIRRLIKELQNNSKIEVANILKNLKGMLDDVNQCRNLVEVLRQARISGKTIEEMTAAINENEQIVIRLGELTTRKQSAEDTAKAAKEIVDKRIADRDVQSKKLSHRLAGIFRTDTTLDDRVTSASTVAEAKNKILAGLNLDITDLNAKRNKSLESGPLTILRSLDETDDNLTQRLVSSGDKGIDTINGAQKSVLQLMQRALFSEAEVDKISRRVADKQITLTILKSGLSEASSNTNEFKEGLEAKGKTAEDALAASKQSGTSILETAKNETAAINVRNDIGQVIDYQSRLNDTISEMNVTVSKNIERQGETDRSKDIVQGTKKSITILGRDTLNTVAGNLEGVLHNLVADQTDETQSAIAAFAHAAEEVKQGSLEGMITRQKEMHQKDIGLLDDTIKRLNASSEMIAKTLETSVDEGVALASKRRELNDAAAQLDNATATMRTVVGKMSNDSVQDKPVAAQ